jgi:hypothetical protein
MHAWVCDATYNTNQRRGRLIGKIARSKLRVMKAQASLRTPN